MFGFIEQLEVGKDATREVVAARVASFAMWGAAASPGPRSAASVCLFDLYAGIVARQLWFTSNVHELSEVLLHGLQPCLQLLLLEFHPARLILFSSQVGLGPELALVLVRLFLMVITV